MGRWVALTIVISYGVLVGIALTCGFLWALEGWRSRPMGKHRGRYLWWKRK